VNRRGRPKRVNLHRALVGVLPGLLLQTAVGRLRAAAERASVVLSAEGFDSDVGQGHRLCAGAYATASKIGLGRALEARIRLGRSQQGLHKGHLLFTRHLDGLVLGDHPARGCGSRGRTAGRPIARAGHRRCWAWQTSFTGGRSASRPGRGGGKSRRREFRGGLGKALPAAPSITEAG